MNGQDHWLFHTLPRHWSDFECPYHGWKAQVSTPVNTWPCSMNLSSPGPRVPWCTCRAQDHRTGSDLRTSCVTIFAKSLHLSPFEYMYVYVHVGGIGRPSILPIIYLTTTPVFQPLMYLLCFRSTFVAQIVGVVCRYVCVCLSCQCLFVHFYPKGTWLVHSYCSGLCYIVMCKLICCW